MFFGMFSVFCVCCGLTTNDCKRCCISCSEGAGRGCERQAKRGSWKGGRGSFEAGGCDCEGKHPDEGAGRDVVQLGHGLSTSASFGSGIKTISKMTRTNAPTLRWVRVASAWRVWYNSSEARKLIFFGFFM
ncbi:MAG: hypothetical protein AN484_21040 [Aphanizomenon flos-aquae WA102]|uniref:Uncharacterized protein n=1 Tax=Aphanizomenon flos-aquae WA102 TaxID=1710896 RepID=A0A1B7WW97_APHFL|nr:MAG: hypothetical protein AN484_21040 [Aphanizomenon flos-aquae WA102]